MGLHAHLLYHPANEVISLYVDSAESQGYDALKSLFYAALKGRYTMSRQTGFMKRVLKAAHAAGDKQTVIDCYLDVLDYSAESAEIDDECFALALDSVSFAETIDHVLVGHIKEQMDARGMDSRVYMAVYYAHIDGGLTTADLINSMARDGQLEKVPNSELFRDELLGQLSELQLDDYVREKINEALANLRPKFDTDFYPSMAEEEPEPEQEPDLPQQDEEQAPEEAKEE